MLKTNIKLDDVDLYENIDLLQIISKVNDEVKVEFEMSIDEIVDMFNFYIKKTAEHIKDIENYNCICPEVYLSPTYNNAEYYFTLNSIDDEDSQSDIEFLQKELKRQFGINFKKDCELKDLFRVLLMDCSDYDIIGDVLKISLYYETYKKSWLRDFLEQKDC